MHSVLDENVPIGGGRGRGLAGVEYRSVESVLAQWSELDGCDPPGGLPGRRAGDEPSAQVNLNDLAWDFLQRFPPN